MGDSTDFTFCQVGSREDTDQLESPKTIPNIKDITLDDNHLHGVSILKMDKSNQVDNLCEFPITEVGHADSLSNNSYGTMPLKCKLKESPRQKETGEGSVSVEEPQEKKDVVKKFVARKKVPFEIGYSQMDWLKLTRTDPDLAGLKGQSNRRLISMDEVRQHKTEGSIWTVLKGRVYNISPYMKFHPGGMDMLMKAAGKDCTSLFNKYHAWVNAEFLLEKCLVGVLDDSSLRT